MQAKLLNHVSLDTRSFILGLQFTESLKYALAKKNILLSSTVLNVSGTLLTLSLKVFFRYKKLKHYTKKPKIDVIKKSTLNNNIIMQLKSLNISSVCIKFINLNKSIQPRSTVSFLRSFKNFKRILFTRRSDLFADFINLSSLILIKKIYSNAYLLLLKQIFSIILKKKHSPYFLFIKKIVKKLIEGQTKILGAKFSISGRLKGKPRTNTLKILSGKIPCQTHSAAINYSKLHAFTRYGVFGLKLWINYK